MIGAGELDQRLAFERRDAKDDGYGNPVSGDWVLQFAAFAKIIRLRGGEGVLAARLEARAPVIITVRNAHDARQITHEWRARDERTGALYAIREQPRLSEDRGFLEFLAEGGVAA